MEVPLKTLALFLSLALAVPVEACGGLFSRLAARRTARVAARAPVLLMPAVTAPVTPKAAPKVPAPKAAPGKVMAPRPLFMAGGHCST